MKVPFGIKMLRVVARSFNLSCQSQEDEVLKVFSHQPQSKWECLS
jgi:hypothetical protein